MADLAIVQLTLTLADDDLDQEELERLTQQFYNQLRDIAEDVERVPAMSACG